MEERLNALLERVDGYGPRSGQAARINHLVLPAQSEIEHFDRDRDHQLTTGWGQPNQADYPREQVEQEILEHREPGIRSEQIDDITPMNLQYRQPHLQMEGVERMAVGGMWHQSGWLPARRESEQVLQEPILDPALSPQHNVDMEQADTDADAEEVEWAAEDILQNHNCQHTNRFVRAAGSVQYEMCHSNIQDFALRCRQCNLLVCRAFRRNRL